VSIMDGKGQRRIQAGESSSMGRGWKGNNNNGRENRKISMN